MDVRQRHTQTQTNTQAHTRARTGSFHFGNILFEATHILPLSFGLFELDILPSAYYFMLLHKREIVYFITPCHIR